MKLFREKPFRLHIKYNQVLLVRLRNITKRCQRNEKRHKIHENKDDGRGDNSKLE